MSIAIRVSRGGEEWGGCEGNLGVKQGLYSKYRYPTLRRVYIGIHPHPVWLDAVARQIICTVH